MAKLMENRKKLLSPSYDYVFTNLLKNASLPCAHAKSWGNGAKGNNLVD